jgi:hypothetical protein
MIDVRLSGRSGRGRIVCGASNPGTTFFRRNRIDRDRLAKVFQAGLTDPVIADRDRLADLGVNRFRQKNAARVGKLLKTCRDIDGVATGMAALDKNLPRVKANTMFDTPVRRLLRSKVRGLPLHPQGTPQGVHGTGEFRHQAITGKREYAAPMLLDFLNQPVHFRADTVMRGLFIPTHQGAVTFDIGSENGRETPLETAPIRS